MKIVILNGELRSGMQMYLALSNHYNVEVALDDNDLMRLLDAESTDITFMELNCNQENNAGREELRTVKKILQKHPQTRVIGICDQVDQQTRKQYTRNGITRVITKPIKNRELFETIESGLA